MRRSSSESSLPLVVIQVFGLLIVTAITVYGIAEKKTEILLAVLAFAGAAVGIGGYFEKVRHELVDAVTPPDDDTRGGP